jgi:hypothetical protein
MPHQKLQKAPATATASAIPLFALALLVAALLLPARAARAQEPSAEPGEDAAEAPPPLPTEGDPGPPPPAETAAPQKPPDQAAFNSALSPYGRWVDTPDYGRVWIPNETARPDWQPYTDGRWVWTATGWAFASTVPWGWAAFHYGRWGWRAGWGWYWVPGYAWGPAWVSWRRVGVHYCWSPYAPRGFVYGRRWPGWVVVPREHFRRPIATVRLARPQARVVLRTARANGVRFHEGVHLNGVQRGTGRANHFAPAPGATVHQGRGHRNKH